MNAIQKAHTIGVGGFGKIRVYYSQQFKRKVIEKTIKPNFFRLRNENSIRLSTLLLNANNYFNNERDLKKESAFLMLMKLAKLDCCVEILGFAFNPFRIIMEYCEGGDLRVVLDQYNVPVQDKMIIILQILSAIQKIHQLKVIHGDLKCKNIFLANKYVPGDFKNIKIKIGDFGLSEVGGNLIKGGTPGFGAPESFKFGGSFESDIYSVGKIMLEIMTQLPVETICAINISNINLIKNRLPKFLNVTTFYNLVIPCLYTDPKKRPTADKLLSIFYLLFGSIVLTVSKVLNKK